MSFLTEIQLSFNSPNKVTSSANNATGYKIYRNIQSDPCPGGVIDPTKEIATGSLSGTNPLTYSDTDTTVSVAYFYRVSWLRGSEEVLGELVGPLMIGSLYELGYPNNVPSNTSGNPNFLNIEPLVHYDATWEYNIGGARSINSIQNLSDNFRSLDLSVGSTDVGTATDGSTPCFHAGSGSYQQTQSVQSQHDLRSDVLSHWDRIGESINEDDVGSVVFDEGVTVAWAFMGCPQHSNYWDSTTNQPKTGWWQGNNSGHMGMTAMNMGSAKQIISTTPVLPKKFSDGTQWVDPKPPYGIPDPHDPGWMPRWSHHSNRHAWKVMNTGNGWWGNTWASAFNVRTYRSNISTNNYIPKGGVGSNYPLIDPYGVNVYLATIYPDGSYRLYINGNLEISNSPLEILLGDLTGSPTSYDIASTGSWHIDTDGTVDQGAIYDQSVADFGEFKVPFAPMPEISLPRLVGTHEKFKLGSAIYTLLTSATDWCEYLVFPKAFTKTDTARLHNYFSSKYSNLSDTHRDYSG